MDDQNGAEDCVGERCGVEEGKSDGRKVQNRDHALGSPHLHVVAGRGAGDGARS